MEGDQDTNGQERIEPAGVEEGGAVNGDDDGVVADTNDAEDDEDHKGAEAPQRGAEPEHVPRHDHRPRSHRPPSAPLKKGTGQKDPFLSSFPPPLFPSTSRVLPRPSTMISISYACLSQIL